MKKLIAMIAVFALCVMTLTACSFRPAGEPQAVPGTYTLEQVPALTIAPLTENAAVGSESFLPSNYSWSWPKGNGENEAVEACGFGPTDPAIRNYLDPIYLDEPVTVKLIWASFPAQSVNVVSWDVDVLDLPSDADQAQQDSYLREVTLTEAEEFERTLLLEPDRVYDKRSIVHKVIVTDNRTVAAESRQNERGYNPTTILTCRAMPQNTTGTIIMR